jgi:putative SOS response-associated peptidase YedK
MTRRSLHRARVQSRAERIGIPTELQRCANANVPVIRTVDGKRHGSLMRWGLIPLFARDIPPKYSTINARIATVQTAAGYKGPWSHGQRCLMVAQGFYECQVQADGKDQDSLPHSHKRPADLCICWAMGLVQDGHRRAHRVSDSLPRCEGK